VAAVGVCLCDQSRAAAYVICRSDPVLLVNGIVVDVVSTLQSDPSTIRELDYTVTVPAGAVIGTTTLTKGISFPERVTYVFSALQPAGTLRIDATVQTQPGVQPFATTVRASAPPAHVTATGPSNSTVTVQLAGKMVV
jgi:hypothetical protein